MTAYNRTAISLFHLKDTLLYFDYAIPLTGMWQFLMDGFNRAGFNQVGLSSLNFSVDKFQAEVSSFPNFYQTVEAEILPAERCNSHFKDRLFAANKSITMASADSLEDCEERVSNTIATFIEEFNLTTIPVDIAPSAVVHGTEETEIAVTLASLKLVNTEQASWQQIFEFRRDVEAREKLRRLRLCAYENYVGKAPAFVEDDILTRLADYEEAVKKCGFETKSAAMTALLDSKLVAGGVAGSFLSAYFNSPLLAIASGASAIGLTIAKIAVEIGKQRFTLRKIMSDNPVSYIAYGKERLAAPKV